MDIELSSAVADPTPDLRSRCAPIIERAPLPIVEVQGPTHFVSCVNSAFCQLLGKTRQEILGQPFSQLVPRGDECALILDGVYLTGETVTHTQEDDSDVDSASWHYAMWPKLDLDDGPTGVIIHLTKITETGRDASAVNEALLIAGLHQHELTEVAEKLNTQLQQEIDERKLVETALHEAIANLKDARDATERSSKAKDEFLAALSHELRTPLTPVLMAAAALRDDGRLPVDVREQLEMMERNITLEARLIDDLLDLTKISHGKLLFHAQPCDAHPLIDFAFETVRDDARAKNISIDRIFAAQHSGIMADPARFQQVVWNLLRNAVKFTPSGGTITVRTSDQEPNDGERWLRIEVADSGIGVDPALLEQIFLPFDQGGVAGDHRFGGVGLGLAIARAVVDLQGGRISASSTGANQGTTFIVELPGAGKAQIDARALDRRLSVESSAHASGASILTSAIIPLRLLLVEDHESTIRVLTRLLERDGHSVVTAGTAAKARSAAAVETFDLVISDIGLPDGTGIELMETLRDAYGLRGIALSGYGMEEDLGRSRVAGFVAHLVKPISIAELRLAIRSLPPAADVSLHAGLIRASQGSQH